MARFRAGRSWPCRHSRSTGTHRRRNISNTRSSWGHRWSSCWVSAGSSPLSRTSARWLLPLRRTRSDPPGAAEGGRRRSAASRAWRAGCAAKCGAPTSATNVRRVCRACAYRSLALRIDHQPGGLSQPRLDVTELATRRIEHRHVRFIGRGKHDGRFVLRYLYRQGGSEFERRERPAREAFMRFHVEHPDLGTALLVSALAAAVHGDEQLARLAVDG